MHGFFQTVVNEKGKSGKGKQWHWKGKEKSGKYIEFEWWPNKYHVNSGVRYIEEVV